MPSAPASPRTSLLGLPAFAAFMASRVLGTLSFQMLMVAIGWQLYLLTGSALDLGLVGLAQFLPLLTLTPIAGHAADRFPRQRIVALCQLANAGSAAVLLAGTMGGWLSREAILAVVAAIGASRTFEVPTTAALLPTLVDRADIPRATAWSASANQTAQIVGPALGGVLLAIGAPVPYATVVPVLMIAALGMLQVRALGAAPKREPVTFATIFSGFSHVVRDRLVLGCMSLDLLAVLLGAAVALLPVYARDILETGPWGLGLLRAAPAAGALVTSLFLARRALKEPIGPRLFAAVAIFGLATLVFGLSRSLWLSLVALAALGAADVVSVVIRMSLVQIRTPDTLRGRVSAANSLFIGTSNQLGELRAGIMAAALGPVPAVALGGAMAMIVAGLWIRLFPELWRIKRLDG